MIEVRLESYEEEIGVFVGTSRYNQAKLQGKKNSHGLKCDEAESLQHNIDGAKGEVAFAKALNLYYSGSVNTFKSGGDVGKIQVRTRGKDYYDLLVREDDRNGDTFVLVLGCPPLYQIIGYIDGKHAKNKRYLKAYGDREPAYFVPQGCLKTNFLELYEQIVAETILEIKRNSHKENEYLE
ncbi:MAG: hypothetical protein M0R80_08425 [Proteobacteria bacterium]|jgi:hypothetical protein|nr:hypothetical protein [Pseudomonadota bacterium]